MNILARGTPPSDWTIYANGGGWVAWNARLRRRLELVDEGTFAQAVARFEELIGDYWGSR
jgi:hypothetical protein